MAQNYVYKREVKRISLLHNNVGKCSSIINLIVQDSTQTLQVVSRAYW